MWSRLFFKAHVSSVISDSTAKIFNSAYMRALKRIANKPLYQAIGNYTDVQVREELRVPSVRWLLRSKRLCYLGRLVRNGPRPRLALLQARGARGSRMPWTDMILSDLEAMRARLPQKLAGLPDPVEDSRPWLTLMRDIPAEWRELVALACENAQDSQDALEGNTPCVCLDGGAEFVCDECGKIPKSAKGLSQHSRAKHGRRSDWRLDIGADAKCPC